MKTAVSRLDERNGHVLSWAATRYLRWLIRWAETPEWRSRSVTRPWPIDADKSRSTTATSTYRRDDGRCRSSRDAPPPVVQVVGVQVDRMDPSPNAGRSCQAPTVRLLFNTPHDIVSYCLHGIPEITPQRKCPGGNPHGSVMVRTPPCGSNKVRSFNVQWTATKSDI